VEAWLSRARCLVFPSIWSDASPLTVREALAKGVPVICGEWNAGSEAIEHGKTGFVASDSSPSTWQALIREAERKAEELSCNAYRAYWSDPVDEVRHGELLLAVYEKATSAQRIAN
jgi:glycosyltransferase involved in cell wall biosynthesis